MNKFFYHFNYYNYYFDLLLNYNLNEEEKRLLEEIKKEEM